MFFWREDSEDSKGPRDSRAAYKEQLQTELICFNKLLIGKNEHSPRGCWYSLSSP